MCGRNRLGGSDNGLLSLSELSVADVARILRPGLLSRMQFIHFCGNFGDPAVAKDLFPALKYIRSCNRSIGIGLSTNGSVRSPAWWSSVGTMLNGPNDACRFAIDGLSDTNSLYRRGTHFNKIMKNACAFIGAGGNASWVFLLFRHNEHQVEEAQALAMSMGFKSFQLKRTSRFPKDGRLAVLNRDGSSAGYDLLPPSRHTWRHPLVSSSSGDPRNSEGYLDNTPISCKVGVEKSVYVSAEGLVFPCCWTAYQLYDQWKSWQSLQMQSLLQDMGGKSAISAKTGDLEEIVDGPFFRAVEESWTRTSCGSGRLAVCARTCGSHDAFSGQFLPNKEIQ